MLPKSELGHSVFKTEWMCFDARSFGFLFSSVFRRAKNRRFAGIAFASKKKDVKNLSDPGWSQAKNKIS